MPISYYAITKKDRSFSEFVWDSARQMTPFFHMRDDGNDVQLRFPEPSPRGTKNNAEALVLRIGDNLRRERVDLDAEKSKTSEQFEAEYEAHKIKTMEEYEETLARKTLIRERALRLKSETADWRPPTSDHEFLKKAMLESLDQTLEREGTLPKKPEFTKTAAEWNSDHVKWLQDYVDRLEGELQEQVDAANASDAWQGDIAWIEKLIASVPPPPGRFEG